MNICQSVQLITRKYPYLHLRAKSQNIPFETSKLIIYCILLFGNWTCFNDSGNRPSPHPPPQLFGHSKRHVALQLASMRWSSSPPPAGTAPASVCGFGRYTCCPGAATSSDIKRRGVCRKAALWPLVANLLGFFFGI